MMSIGKLDLCFTYTRTFLRCCGSSIFSFLDFSFCFLLTDTCSGREKRRREEERGEKNEKKRHLPIIFYDRHNQSSINHLLY